MSYFHGKQGKGAARIRKAVLTAEGEARRALTPEHRRKAFRLGPVTSPDGIRTERSIRVYRTQFLADNGNTPENIAEIAERLISR